MQSDNPMQMAGRPEPLSPSDIDLPDGWSLGSIGDCISENGLFADGDWVETKDQDPNGNVRLIQLADIGDGYYKDKSNRYLTSEKAQELDCTYLVPGDILVARLPEPLGRACIFPGDKRQAVTAVDVCIIRPGSFGCDPLWLMNAINSPYLRVAIREYEKGTTRPRISRRNLASLPLRVPPFREQKRIVAKIQHLLESVNSARDHLSRVPAILKRFRQAVLAAACSGRLTEDWRTQNASEVSDVLVTDMGDTDENTPELPEGWRWQELGKAAKVERGRFSVRPRNDPAYYDGRFPFVQIGDLPPNGGEIVNYKQSLNERGLGVSKCFPKGTVLIAIVGATIGNTGVLTFDSCCPDSLVAIKANGGAMSRFFEYYLRWKKLKIRNESYASGGQPNINLQTLIPLPVPVPPPNEVEAIVCRAETLFRQAERVERSVAVANHRCDLLRDALLAKAFRGELVPTEAELARREGRDYEPASVLLERIKKAREGQSSVKRERRTPRPTAKLAAAKGQAV